MDPSFRWDDERTMRPQIAETQSQGVLEIVGPDLEDLLGFYVSMGFELERRSGDFAVVHWQGTRLFLAGHTQAQVADQCWRSIRIMVDDVDALWRKANDLRLRIVNPIADRAYGLRDFVIADPAGFGLRFAQVTPT
jgi:catechol 2,3-dioxygenase-like lactoylglutathione lyase family enzyme